MEEIFIDICVCKACVLSGAVNLLTSLKSIEEFEESTKRTKVLNIRTYISKYHHEEKSPLIKIDGQYIPKANVQKLSTLI